MEGFREMFEALREECPAAVWSQGISLARSAIVTTERKDDDEIHLKVRSPVGILARTVMLFPEDEDWTCDCNPREEICEHIVAATLAVKSALDSGEELVAAAPEDTPRIGYRFRRAGGGLRLDRMIVFGGDEQGFRGSAARAAIDPTRAINPTVTPADLEVERALGHRIPEWIPPQQMKQLIKLLRDVGDVQLDGRPITMELKRVGLRACVADAPGGYMLSIAQDDLVAEVFSSGVALCTDGTLRPLSQPDLSPSEIAELRQGLFYPKDRAAPLITEALPALRKALPVEITAKTLPQIIRVEPRISVDARTEGHELVVLPTIVYGDPAVARLDGKALMLFGDVIPERDMVMEARLKKRIDSQLGLNAGYRARFKDEQAVAFAARLDRWEGGDVDGDLESFHVTAPLEVGIGEDGFPVRFTSGGGSADPATVLQAWRTGSSLIPLDSGGWAPLPHDWMRRFGETLADLLAARNDRDEVPKAALADVARLCEAMDRPTPPAFRALKDLVHGFERLPAATLPTDLTATLRPYQKAGVSWLQFLREGELGALLADDMGLGKTLQTLCAVKGRSLVVAPTSVMTNWASEAAAFRPDLKVSTYHGTKRQLDPDADLTLTTYAIMRLDAEILSAVTWSTLVLDEAQAIKNPESQVARAAFRLRADFRVALTGTPVENRLDELWSQMHFVNPGLLGGRSDFQDRYAKRIAEGQPGAAARLRERIKPFVLRRMKREVAPELPPRTDLILHCDLSSEERDVYDAIKAATQREVIERLGTGGSVFKALEALLRLRQAACHRALLPGQVAESSSKVERLIETLATAVEEGHKALVFSQWTGMLDLVEPWLEAGDIGFVRLDGSTRDRAGVVSAFQDDNGPPVMLISLKAGGTGLNLTAADHVFMLDPWWNPAVEDQAADRAHRIGQDKPVFVHKLVARDTVEEGIIALQESKRALADAALGGADRATGLTRDDLMALLQ